MLLMMQMGLRIEKCAGCNGVISTCKTVFSLFGALSREFISHPEKPALVTQSPKTQSSERDIPIPTGILSLLEGEYVGQSNEVWFLSDSNLRPVEPRCYYKSLQGYLKQAQVPVVRPHALRHTFATTCLQAGCNVKTLSELMGHSNPDITLKRYAHSCWEWKQNEMNRIYG